MLWSKVLCMEGSGLYILDIQDTPPATSDFSISKEVDIDSTKKNELDRDTDKLSSSSSEHETEKKSDETELNEKFAARSSSSLEEERNLDVSSDGEFLTASESEGESMYGEYFDGRNVDSGMCMDENLKIYLQDKADSNFFTELASIKSLNSSFQTMWDLSDTTFQIRDSNYLEDGIKIPSLPTLASLLHMEIFEVPERVDHIVEKLGTSCVVNLLQRFCHEPPFILALNFQVPGATLVNCVVYWALPPWFQESVDEGFSLDELSSEQEDNSFLQTHLRGSYIHKLINQFINGSDEFRNERFKLIPHMIEGRWVAKKAVANVPTLLGQKVTQRYFRGNGYLEIDVDVGSSYIASKILRVLRSATSSLVIDVGYLIQGNSEEELPERMLGQVRFVRLEFQSVEDTSRLQSDKSKSPKGGRKGFKRLSYLF